MTCHTPVSTTTAASTRIALVGHPNVGKSVFFQYLTGQRAIVSNYPGTTVEMSRGALRTAPDLEVLDTPGVITLPAHSDDEAVTECVLLDEPLSAILQVGDAKNPRRTLMLSVQLAEMGMPLVLALNMHDEAAARGVRIETEVLQQALGIPVLLTTATRRQGLEAVQHALQAAPPAALRLEYPAPIEHALTRLKALLPPAGIAPRALGLLYLSGDALAEAWLRERMAAADLAEAQAIRAEAGEDAPVHIQRTRLAWVDALLPQVVHSQTGKGARLGAALGRLSTHPLWGMVILAGVLYALYWFVGVFGAGTLVDYLENVLFGAHVNPALTGWVQRVSPHPFLTDLLVGEYGLWTMGMTYALALILPIVTTFFFAFGLLEDSGYLPRLAALSNRFFAALGLNGKAVLPMVLGLGCVTMATLTTRVLESRRERVLATLLLALAIPCSAQLGVVMGMLAGVSFGAALIWGGMVLLVLFVVGWLAARLMPGERTPLLVELPPLRWPLLSNVLMKTLARLEWYVREVIPLFLLGALLMFTLDKTHLLQALIRVGEPLVQGWLGLPPQASAAFLMGFLRRDFGATGLYLLNAQGLLSPEQVVVSMVTITLFVPCIASVLMMARERDWRTALGILAVVFPLALLVGGLLHRALLLLHWGLA
ncbi:MAG: ferrous iron transport protein B [Anaerolineales bacterium]